MSNPRRGCPACGHLHTESEQCDFRPVPEGEHNRADAPPSAIDAALSWRKADCAPALPLDPVLSSIEETTVNPPLDIARKCRRCELDACSLERGTLCPKHHRFAKMRKHSKEGGKTVPSLEELEVLAAALVEMKCPVCSRVMSWIASGSWPTKVTIQHDRDGTIRLLCHACNCRHHHFADDSFYALGPDRKRCRLCGMIGPLESFASAYGASGWGGKISLCKDCERKRSAALLLRRSARIKRRVTIRRALEEAEDALLDVKDGTASYTDIALALGHIADLLRGGLGDDAA